MSSCIHHDHTVASFEQNLSLAHDPDAIVSDAVEKQDPIAIRVSGTNFPSPQRYAIGSTHFKLLAQRAQARECCLCFSDQFAGQLPTKGMEKHGTDEPPAHGCE